MNPFLIDSLLKNALQEDLTWGDITTETLIPATLQSEMVLLQKANGVVAGLTVAERAFHLLDDTLDWQQQVVDGQFLNANTILARIGGKTRSILMAERVALNFLQRLSGIATLTREYASRIKNVSETVKLVDTRKTTPGLRSLEKYAVRTGGGFNHRYNLSDAVLIKDNHLAVLTANGIDPVTAITDMRRKIPHTTKIELEVDSIQQLEAFLNLEIDIFLLDNMNSDQLSEAVKIVNGKAYTEASGGITLDNIEAIAATGVDFISVGALTHSAPALDISLDFA